MNKILFQINQRSICSPNIILPIFVFLFIHSSITDLKGQTYTMPASGSSSSTTCSGTFYDSGGAGGDYGNGESGEYTFCSDDGNKLILNFTCFDVENHSSCSYDRLAIYDGSNTSATKIGDYCNNNLPHEIKASGTCLHIVFTSDGSQTHSGWEASISCSATSSPSVGGGSGACTDNLLNDPGFENCITFSERFPNSTLTLSDNAEEHDNFGQWNFDDGGNSNGAIWIEDATRASEGEQFLYIKTFGSSSSNNRCVGNVIDRVSSGNFDCNREEYTNGYRYVISFDWISFNQSVPGGGPSGGVTAPRFEYDFPSYATLYNSSGAEVSMDGTGTGTRTGYTEAVDWADISSSWQRAYGVTPAMSADDPETMWISHADDGTAGMLADNVDFSLLNFSEVGEASISCGGATNEMTFTLNPNSNIGGVPGILYDVSVPAGFTISPAQGTYGSATSFTVTSTSDGDFSDGSPSSVNVTVSDEINTHVSVVEAIGNPYPCAPFPVELIGLDVKLDVNRAEAVVNWTTASETNVDYFQIERSTDEVSFDSIGKLSAHGLTTDLQAYQYRDQGVRFISATYLYRLKVVDIDGAFTYSHQVELDLSAQISGPELRVYPVPAENILHIDSKLVGSNEGSLKILNMIGQSMLHQTIDEAWDQKEISVRGWPQGIYIIQLESGGQIKTEKVLVRP